MRTRIEPRWDGWYFYLNEQREHSVLFDAGGHDCAMADISITEQEYVKMINSPKEAYTLATALLGRGRDRKIRTPCQPTEFECIPDKLESAEEYTLRTGL